MWVIHVGLGLVEILYPGTRVSINYQRVSVTMVFLDMRPVTWRKWVKNKYSEQK